MAKRRDDYLINLLITSQNLAEGDIKNLGKQIEDLDQQINNLNQSERRRTDTLTAAQRENAKVSKQNQDLIDQSKKAAEANEKEIDSIDKKTKAVKEENSAFSVFYSNFEKNIQRIKRDLNQKKIDIDITAAKASITEVSEALTNLEKASKRKGLSEEVKEDIDAQIEKLKVIKKSYQQELDNLNITKQSIKVKEEQRKVEESLNKEREKAEAAERNRLSQQGQAIKLDSQIADIDRKKAKAKKDFIVLLSEEEEKTKAAATGKQREIAAFQEWQGSVEKAKRELESYGATQEEITEIENNAERSNTRRTLQLAKASTQYVKSLERERAIRKESSSLSALQIARLKEEAALQDSLREKIEVLGGTYQDLDKRVVASSEKSQSSIQKNISTLDKLRNVIAKAKGGRDIDVDRRRNPILGFVIAFREAGDSAGVLSRKLGRLGLAIRGLAIVGVLTFMQSLVSVLGAVGAQITALVASLLSAASVLVISFIPAIAQAIPIIGALGAAFSRLSAIQEAVNQADLAKKQAFGDTGAEKKATDASLQIADAQRRVKEAQEGVTEARKEAKKELQDLILREKEAELAFKSATLSQIEARNALKETIASGDVDSLARSQLGIEESALDRARSRRELREARRARRAGRQGGVEGTETYKNSIKSLADAQRSLAQAQRSAADSANKQSAAQRNLGFFLNELSAAEKRLFKQFMGLRERYEKVFRPITDIIIRAFSRGLVGAEKVIFSSGIVNGFRTLAQTLGKSIDRIFAVLTSPAFKQFFVTTLGEAAKNVPVITTAFILLANIFKEISIAAAPALRAILEFIVEKLGELNNTVSDTNSFTEFLMMGVTHFEAWIELIISILNLLGQIMQASSGSAIETISSLTDTINGAADALKADDSGARNFFDDAAESAKFLGNVIVEIGKAIVELTSTDQVKALSDVFTEALIPGMVQGIKVVGFLALGFDKLLENDLFAKLAQLGIALFFISSALSAVRAIFLPAFVLIKGLGSAFAAVGPFISAFVGNLSIVQKASQALSKAWFFSTKPAGLLGILKSIGPAIKNAGGLFAVFRKGLAAIPVVGWIVVGAIEAIIGIIMALKDNFLGITDMLGEALGGLGDAFSNLFSAFGGEGEGGGGFGVILDVLGKILGVIGDIVGFVGKLIGFVVLIAIIEGIIKPLTFVINTIADIINVWSTFVNDVKKDGIGKALTNLGKNIFKAFGRLIGRLLALVFRLPILVAKGLIAAVKALWSGIKSLFKLAIKGIISLFNLVVSGLKTIFTPSAVINVLSDVGNAIGNFFENLPGAIWNILKAAGKAIWEGLVEGIGAGTAEKIVNFMIGIINSVIDKVNSVTPDFIGDIGRLEEVDIKEKRAKEPSSPAGERKSKVYSGDTDKDTKSQEKNNKSKKQSAKFNLDNYKALNLNAGASRRNARLNNQLAGSLDQSSKAHRRAQRLQEALNKAAERGRNKQRAYAESVRKTAAAEERMARALARARGSRKEINDRERASVRVRSNLQEKTRDIARAENNFSDQVRRGSNLQDKYNTSLRKTYKAKIDYGAVTKIVIGYQTRLNSTVKRGETAQDKYAKSARFSSKQMEAQQKDLRQLARRFAVLNRVLRVTGENSRALGMVFKNVTNKLLTEFNVEPLKVKLPEVGGMFKKAMGDTQGFQTGGYFGNKKLRRKDDRLIKVAGGEAILTGYHQPEVNKALAFANSHGVTEYSSLDSMFSREKRPHYSAPSAQIGGPNGGDSNYKPRRRTRKAEGRTPMGYAWRGDSPQGLKEAIRKIAGATMYKYPFLSASSTLRNDPGSHHGAGEAVDLATLPYSRMNEPAIWLGSSYGRSLQEGIFNPSLSIQSGQRVPSSFWGPSTWAAHANHIHIAALGGEVTAGGLPGGGMMAAPQIKKVKIKAPKNSIGKLLNAQAETLRSGANKKIKKEFNAGNMMGMDGGVLTRQQVAQIAKRALSILNMPTDKESIRRLVWLAYKESGFNPRSLNDWDSNAAAGDPSRGLMQTIGATFNSYKLPKFGNIWNPLHNMIASIRYQMARYGQLVTWSPYSSGGMVPEFDNGGIVPGPIGQPRLVKAHGGEMILPTHKYNTGGMVPRYQRGGRVDVIDVPKVIQNANPKKTKGLERQLKRLSRKANNAETAARKIYFAERIQEVKDRLLLSKEMKKFNKEIRDINKKIREQKKKLKDADKEERKEIQQRLKELRKELSAAKKDKRATVAFKGETYNLRNVGDFVQLTSDRLKSFLKNIETLTRRLALATAKWTFKALKIDGKTVVSRTNSALQEARRGLSDLLKERSEVLKGIAQASKGEEKARKRLRNLRKRSGNRIDKLQNQIDRKREKLSNTTNKQERERLKKEIEERQKAIEEERKRANKSAQELQTLINQQKNARIELIEREAELLASIYEQQQAVFEARLAKFETEFTKLDTQIQIATLRNQDTSGNLTEAGRAAVIDLYNKRGEVFAGQRRFLENQLAEAVKAKDIERRKELEQALLENELAVLQNTQSIKELDGSINGVFDFKSTNWEKFRQAVFTGNSAQVLPQFASQIPQLASGGYVTREGLAYLHAAEVVIPASNTGNGGPLVDTINFTEPMEVADPIALSNQIGFKLSTLKSSQ